MFDKQEDKVHNTKYWTFHKYIMISFFFRIIWKMLFYSFMTICSIFLPLYYLEKKNEEKTLKNLKKKKKLYSKNQSLSD